MASSSGSKAFFTNVDTGSVFFVQFNPKEFKLDEKADWKASDEHENDVPLLTYEKGEPTVVTMDLVFDSTDDGSDVYEKYVEPLRDFLTADVQVTDNEGDKMKRPPYCKFSWASFTFDCVIEKLSATCLMFKPDGTALRAKVQVGLKERVRNVGGGGTDSVTLSAVGTMFRGAASRATTYTTQNGDTLSAIAAKTRARLADIAIANDIEDPMEIAPGQTLVIPADRALANILARHHKKKHSGKWQGPPGGRGPRARGGYMGGSPSAFEDPPVPLDYDVDPGGIALQYASFGAMDYGARDDSEGAGGSGGQGIGLGDEKGDGSALDFRDDATPDKEGVRRAALDYLSRGDSQGAGGTGGQGSGGYDVDADSQLAGGTGGQGSGGYDVRDGGLAGAFRNNASPDEQGAGPSAQGYDVRDGSEGTFGDAGQGSGGYDVRDGGAAGAFRNNATPDEQGAGATAQGYDVRGGSEGTFGDAGEGSGGYDVRDGGAAGAFRNNATPDEQGAGATAQGYGVRGGSEGTFGDAGEGSGGYDVRSGGAAGQFRNDATPDAQGSGPSAQGYGGHGSSDTTFGTAGEGGGAAGSFGQSDQAGGTAGQGAGSGGGGFGLSDRADGTAGQGAGPGGSGFGQSDQAGGTAGQGAGPGGGGFGLSDRADGTAGQGASGGGGFGLSERAVGASGGGSGAVRPSDGGTGGGSSGGGDGLSDQAVGDRGTGEGGPRDSFKDVLASHGRVEGDGAAAGSSGGAGDGGSPSGGGGAGVSGADGGRRHGADFKDAFASAKATAEKKKSGE